MIRKLKLGWDSKKPDSETFASFYKDYYSKASYKGFSIYWTVEANKCKCTYLIRPDGVIFCLNRTMFMNTIIEYIHNCRDNLMSWHGVGAINGKLFKRIKNT